jgi:hypothetical protein
MEIPMYPYSYTGLRLVHDEKVRDAMERARIDAELVRNSQRTEWLSLLSSVPMLIRSRLNVFARVEHLRRSFPLRRPCCPPEKI